MADNTLENDALPEPQRPISVHNENQTVERTRDVQERQDLWQSVQQDTKPPTKDWQLKKLLLKLGNELKDCELENMKSLFSGEDGLGKAVLERIRTPMQLFDILEGRGWLSRDNLLYLQAALHSIERMDLIKVAAKYAQKIDGVVHFYPECELVNGFRSVRLHVYGHNYKNATRDDIQAIRMKYAELLFCPPELIVIAGVEPANSLILTFHLPQAYMMTFKDLLKTAACKVRLKKIGIDFVEIPGDQKLIPCSDEDKVTISISEEQRKLANVYQELERKKKNLESAEIKIVELKGQMEIMEKEKAENENSLKSLKEKIQQYNKYVSNEQMSSQTKAFNIAKTPITLQMQCHKVYLNSLNLVLNTMQPRI